MSGAYGWMYTNRLALGIEKMRLLIYQWSAFLEKDIFDICKEKGISFKSFSWKFEDKNVDEKF